MSDAESEEYDDPHREREDVAGTVPIPAFRPRALGPEDNKTKMVETPPVKIGLWGPTGSGKTTYLAALQQAVLRADPSIGRWNMIAVDGNSKELLTKWSQRLVIDQRFPEKTEFDTAISLKWLLLGNLAGSRYDHRRKLRRGRELECKFLLDLVDVSGEAFADPGKGPAVPQHIRDRALDHLENADGLIYLFDPIIDRDEKSAAVYLNTTLADLHQRMIGEMEGNHLPKEVSVCVTKFDHPDLFKLARQAGLVNYGPDGMPRVLDKHAESFFNILCTEDPWGDSEHDGGGNSGAEFIRKSLENSFHPEKIEYYVTSSIGYRKPPGWNPTEAARADKFDPTNFSNTEMSEDGKTKIRGPIHPINILEPLISLQQRAAASAKRK